MSKRQVIVFDGYVDPKPAGPPCCVCAHYPEICNSFNLFHCDKRDVEVNSLGTCNLWAEEAVEQAEDVAETISE